MNVATDNRILHEVTDRVLDVQERLEPVKDSMSEALRRFRKENGLSQVQIAEAFEVSQGTISAWEIQGTGSLANALLIAAALNVSVEQLVGLAER